MTKLNAKETLVSTFTPFTADDGVEIKRLEDIPRDMTLREGIRAKGSEAPPHCHEWGQLLYASQGVMQVMAQGSIWVIPPQTIHSIKVIQSVTMRNVYFAPHVIEGLPLSCQVMSISPLLRELIAEAIHYPALYDQDAMQGRVCRLILDCLKSAPRAPLHLPVPTNGPIEKIAHFLKENPSDEATLQDWAQRLSTTSRTLARNFKKQTDMTFGQWRQQARLLEALSRLAAHQPIAHIAQDLGYSSQSAFSAMFKKALGVTPGNYFKDMDR
ncbi:putative AraC family transcriptional regulator [Candidatus Terasakiella magnetica]|uniref:Putative AraC family transcriptional regulator n=1 Tax=Candidatus Terasakiella magnetica TaxID=1867952 RepID=A0A1C3RKW6_9PROT|nr:helix-turn-helix transcriptional regulator [Candidatus Terasakiella magnetica]SCA57914.1 putative AraC family transcriptional regulator [Candidatus Terasakiella magnetica]